MIETLSKGFERERFLLVFLPLFVNHKFESIAKIMLFFMPFLPFSLYHKNARFMSSVLRKNEGAFPVKKSSVLTMSVLRQNTILKAEPGRGGTKTVSLLARSPFQML